MNNYDENRVCNHLFLFRVKQNPPLASAWIGTRIGNCEMRSPTEPHACALHEMKVLQASKIRSLSETLIAAGYITLDDQAKVLGIPRSTAWTILRSAHKGSGLSAATINRMLSSPTLPGAIRVKIIEYVKEKSAGLYGHSGAQLLRFNAQVAAHVFYDCPMKAGDPRHHSRARIHKLHDRRIDRKA